MNWKIGTSIPRETKFLVRQREEDSSLEAEEPELLLGWGREGCLPAACLSPQEQLCGVRIPPSQRAPKAFSRCKLQNIPRTLTNVILKSQLNSTWMLSSQRTVKVWCILRNLLCCVRLWTSDCKWQGPENGLLWGKERPPPRLTPPLSRQGGTAAVGRAVQRGCRGNHRYEEAEILRLDWWSVRTAEIDWGEGFWNAFYRKQNNFGITVGCRTSWQSGGGGGCAWVHRLPCNPRMALGRSTENLKFGGSQTDKQFVGVWKKSQVPWCGWSWKLLYCVVTAGLMCPWAHPRLL